MIREHSHSPPVSMPAPRSPLDADYVDDPVIARAKLFAKIWKQVPSDPRVSLQNRVVRRYREQGRPDDHIVRVLRLCGATYLPMPKNVHVELRMPIT